MSKQPNILFLFSDQHRGDWMPYDPEYKKAQGVEDLELNMPVIRALMDQGTAFTQAISPAPVCAPARACLAAGKRYRSCRVFWNTANYDAALPSFYNKLHNAGYYVCGTGKFDLNKADLEWGDGYHKLLQDMGFDAATDSEGKMDTIWAAGLDNPGPYGRMLQEHGWLEAHKEDMLNRGNSDKVTPLPDDMYADNWVGEKSKQMLAGLSKDQPWFMQVNFSGPHDPWDVTQKMKDSVKDRTFPMAADCPFEEANQKVRQNYAAMIENIDRLCGEIIDVVRQRGELENTVIVYAADHGEMMGDHGLYGKSKPGHGSIHIPMVISAPAFGAACGKTVTAPVELQDLANTFLDYAGLEHTDNRDSQSLRPILEGKTERVRDLVVSELMVPRAGGKINSFAVIFDGKWKVIIRPNGAEQLYDIENDPFEMNDLAAEHPEMIEEYKKELGKRDGRKIPGIEQYAKSFMLMG